LSDRKGICKTAKRTLEMAVNGSEQCTARCTILVQRVLAWHVRMLRMEIGRLRIKG